MKQPSPGYLTYIRALVRVVTFPRDRGFWTAALAALAVLGGACTSPPTPATTAAALAPAVTSAGGRRPWSRSSGESILARGILAEAGGALVLFAEVRRCTVEQALPVAQILASTDAGKTWSKCGPEIEGSSFEYAHATATGQLWVVGLHTAEGPGIDPFVLVPGAQPWALALRRVREGPSELEGGAYRLDGSLSIWIRDIDDRGDGAKGPLYVYETRNEGITWSQSAHASTAGMIPLTKIRDRSGDWRIANRPDGGFDVQLLAATRWRTAAAFPFRACEETR